MKRLLFLAISCAVLMLLLISADYLVLQRQSATIRGQFGRDNFLAAAEARIQLGMTRQVVEAAIAGFRDCEIETQGFTHYARYSYWFGFIPPFPAKGIKYVGEIEVVYSSQWEVLDSSYWVN